MQRVVVTGLGVVSSIGCNADEVADALRHGHSGLTSVEALLDAGFSCSVYGPVKGWNSGSISSPAGETPGSAAAYAAVAASDAVRDARLQIEQLEASRSGVIVGTAFGGINELSRMHALLSTGEKSHVQPGDATRAINSGPAANLAATFALRSRVYSVSTSFASGVDNIGHAYELIGHGMMDVALCGATEEDSSLQIGSYVNNWGGFPRDYNDRPTEACRPYDVQRQGFIMSAGSGILLLESLEHAQGRDAPIYAEIVGYGSANDGADMFRPTGQGLTRAIRQALEGASRHGVERIDYVNTHGTGTPVGDRIECEVLRRVIGEEPLIGSTKGLTGHAMAASGALEAIYTLLMIERGFVAPTTNLQTVADDCTGLSHVQKTIQRKLGTAMTFSVGLGGFNSSLVFRASPRNR